MFLLPLSFTIEIFFPTKCKREAGVKGQTFLEVIVASLKSQGKKERTTLDNCIQKESDCLGLKLNNVWIPALFWNRLPEGACGVDERERLLVGKFPAATVHVMCDGKPSGVSI